MTQEEIIKFIEGFKDKELLLDNMYEVCLPYYRSEEQELKDAVVKTTQECDISLLQGYSYTEAGIINFGALCVFFMDKGLVKFNKQKLFYK